MCRRPTNCLLVCSAILLLTTSALMAQNQDDPERGMRKQARAVRVDDGTVSVDGRLDERVWQDAPPITDFIQKEPDEGAPPTERMEVRFVYDASAIYVAARMYSRNPSDIQAPMGRRDSGTSQAEHIFVSLDTFLDRRTAYTFGVTASGVRLDHFHRSDDENDTDSGFDPVWQARTSLDDEGWTAELWIPFTQLRFNDRPEQVWGLNVRRFTPTLEEENYWVLVPRTERAWASRFGDLRGIQDVRPSRRLELLPYLAGSATMNGARDPGNPFDQAVNLASRTGLDLKMGLGSNLTLDAAVNPDFGQVEADPAEVNLSEFETRFAERRPFFTEGAQLLHITNNFLYTRRIGARPTGPALGDFVDYPTHSTILGAAKVTGRLDSGTSLGVLAAVTDEEFAEIANVDSPDITRTRVTARTAYGMARVQQEFGELASTASVGVGFVHRDLAAGDPLAARLVRDYFVAAGDTTLRLKGGEYELRAAATGTLLNGEEAAIERVQRSSVLYLQRPDREDGRFDPTRRSLNGFSMSTGISRVNGEHWLFSASSKFETAEYETNNLGKQLRADGIEPNLTLQYRETQPGRIFRNYSIAVNKRDEWNWTGNHYSGSIRPSIDLTWSNFWTTSFSVTYDQRVKNTTLARGGPRVGTPQGWTTEASVGNSRAAETQWSGHASIGNDENGGMRREGSLGLSFRPDPRWQLSIEPFYSREINSQQYVTTRDDGRPETFGHRYIFAYIEQSTLSTQLRATLTLKPDVTLDIYAEPFAASGRYYDYGELLAPGSRDRLTYGTGGTTIEQQADGSHVVTADDSTFTLRNLDFNVRSFRSNVVLRWEWTPGSTFHIVWQQDRFSREAFGTRVGPGDLLGSLGELGTNIVLVKTSFWLPVL